MLKREIKFISDLNLNKLQVLGDRISIKDIQKSRIHPALIKYIVAAIEKELYLDKKRITENSIFNYEGDRIENYFKLIAEEVKLSHNFDFQYIKRLLQQAIVFTTNYLAIPKQTLTNHIFDENGKKSIQEIILGIEHAYYYKYLQKILFTYLDKKQIRSMAKDEFLALLNRIDEISRETHLEDTLTTAINSMGNFFEPNSKGEGRIPYEAISRFLEEKRLDEFSSRLIEKYGVDDQQLINGKELLAVLKSVTPETEMIIEETEKIEEELEVIENDNHESIVPPEEIIENAEQTVERTEFLEIADEEEIPNHEIISDHAEEIESNEKEKLSNDNLDEAVSEESGDEGNIIDEIDNEIVEKKKIETNQILKSIVDLDSVFEKVEDVPQPFADTIVSEHPTQIKTILDGEIVYFIDDSDIVEELETLPDNNTPEIIKEELFENKKHEELSSEIESDNSENLQKDITISDIPVDETSEETQELTEVFTDLAYLENNHQDDEISLDTISEETLNEQSKDEESLSLTESEDEDDKYSISFSELVKQHDMTKIIEYIFDYDMEDYHSILNQISKSVSEDDALKILLDYYKKNHLDLNAEEINQMTSIVSEYFTKSLS